MLTKKKKIAFIIGKMTQGGPARYLLNILSLIDFSKYEVTIILFNPGGLFFKDIPSNVKIEYVNPRGLFCAFHDDKVSYIKWLPIRIILKLIGEILIKLFKYEKQLKWKLKEYFLSEEKNYFSLGIALSEGIPIYYLSRFIKAKVKVGRVPTDYEKANLNKKFDRYYYKNMNYLMSVSDENSRTLKNSFPSLADKIITVENIVSRSIILSKAQNGKSFEDDFEGIRLLTLSRIDKTKGIDLALKACKVLVEEGFNIKWYFMGEGEKKLFDTLSSNFGLAGNFVFLEPKSNPFAFMKDADIYVQPSRYEGKSNAVNEAKALYKPIVITNFTTAPDHIEHMKNGIIAEMNPESLAKSIQKIIDNIDLRVKFSDHLKNNFKSNKEGVKKILNLIDNSS
jgi:glycosyltransferase involved in cell wall biosynthesis